MPKRLTNEIIDERLKDRNIIRIDNYVSKREPIHFQCAVCQYMWKVAPHGIINHGTGCPNCIGNIKITNEIIDQRLKDKKFKRIDDYIDGDKKIKVKCLVKKCNHIWQIYVGNLKNYKSGCPKCAGNAKLSLLDIGDRLMARNIKIMGPYVNTETRNSFKCLKKECGFIWEAKVNSVINNGTGCPNCSNRKFNNEIIDKKLEGRNIIRLDNYINALSKIKFKCLRNGCNNIWEAAPNEVLNKRHGCPKCCAGKNEKIIFSMLTKSNIDFVYHFSIKNKKSNRSKFVVDFYIPSINLFIEYNGDQHYRPVKFNKISDEKAKENFNKQIKRDKALEKYCKKQNINLIWIDGRIYNNNKLEKYLKEDFLLILKDKINGK